MWPEIQTQLHVAAYAEFLADTSRPRIAKVFHYFERNKEETYLVMERVELGHSPPDLPERMLDAITWLATVPAPDGHVPGPLGGGRIRHGFFKRLVFAQPDMHDSNFSVDREGKTVLLDFGEIALLPESFVRFTLSSKEKLVPIIKSLGLSGESNMALMGKIAYSLAMTSDPKLGLDAYGFPATGRN
ncbi:hypothetical protein BKA83DRAFT_2061830 [Pisolithus microcarpus]|nr:hypothetical protein BKA83DRAFT_2061830 [Pisolithus microcarpus]